MTLPMMWVSLAFLGGIVLASALPLPLLIWLALGALGLAGAFVARRLLPKTINLSPPVGRAIPRSLLVLAIVMVGGFMLGAARYQLDFPPANPSQVSWYNDADYEVLLTGTLVDPPDARDAYTNLRLDASAIDTGSGDIPVRGLVLARAGSLQDFRYGDILRLRGRLVTPPSNEDFSYRDYLARQGIRSYMPSAEATLLPGRGGSPVLRLIYALKDVSLRNVYRLFLDPEASLLAGILLGVDTGLSDRLERAFDETGTAHIIAISGFNIAIIAGVFALAFNRLLGSRWGAVVTLAGIAFYTVFVGADPAVVRAAIMGAIGLFAIQVGRRQTGVNTLAIVAAVMAVGNPLILWDVGFQLSILATLGLILYGGLFMDAARAFVDRHIRNTDARRLASPLGQFVLLTFAAQLTTLPIIAFHFRQISLVSPLANALVLPAQPAVMVLGGLAVVASLVLYPLGQLLAWIAWPLTTYTVRLVEFFAALPHSVVYLGSFSLASVLLFYLVLIAVTFAGGSLKNLIASLRAKVQPMWLGILIVVLLAGSLLAWRLVGAAPDGRLHVTFLDVGSADAILIQTPAGRYVLINGGPSTTRVSDALGRRLSPFNHDLDMLIVASGDEQQVASLPRLLPRFPPQMILFGASEGASFSSQALLEQVDEDGIPLTRAEPGQQLDLGEGAYLKVLDVSPRGATLLLEWDSFRLLMPIGANLDTLAELENGAAVGPITVLLLSQGGYAPLTPPEWVNNLHPQLVVISVAPADKDSLPSSETLETLDGYQVLRTDQNGWIEVMTDGSRLWAASERAAPPTLLTPTPPDE